MSFTYLKSLVVKVFEPYLLRYRPSKMSPDLLKSTLIPPLEVSKMTVWQPELFDKTIEVPYIVVEEAILNKVKKEFKKYFLKVPNFPNVQNIDQNTKPIGNSITCDNATGKHSIKSKRILLHPDIINSFEDFALQEKQSLINDYNINPELHFGKVNIQLNYTNFSPSVMIKAVLNDEKNIDNVSGYSFIGHICHVNLKPEVEPYKNVIGQILLQLPNVKTVVNKTNEINNTYRNFTMEVLAGNDDFHVTVKENYVSFQFDFSKVYWNPRLSTEHGRIAQLLKRGDCLYDVFAGVGPFSILTAVQGKPTKKQPIPINVFANDLNPESYKSLVNNVKINGLAGADNIKCFNKDGREFILEDVKNGLIEWFRNDHLQQTCQIHIAMNLPAIATSFLDAFVQLFQNELTTEINVVNTKNLPLVHVYAFSKADNQKEDLKKECEKQLGKTLEDISVQFVRNVAPKKDMFRITFQLTLDILSHCADRNEHEGCKRLKLA